MRNRYGTSFIWPNLILKYDKATSSTWTNLISQVDIFFNIIRTLNKLLFSTFKIPQYQASSASIQTSVPLRYKLTKSLGKAFDEGHPLKPAVQSQAPVAFSVMEIEKKDSHTVMLTRVDFFNDEVWIGIWNPSRIFCEQKYWRNISNKMAFCEKPREKTARITPTGNKLCRCREKQLLVANGTKMNENKFYKPFLRDGRYLWCPNRICHSYHKYIFSVKNKEDRALLKNSQDSKL